jgi:hypothetical protein
VRKIGLVNAICNAPESHLRREKDGAGGRERDNKRRQIAMEKDSKRIWR